MSRNDTSRDKVVFGIYVYSKSKHVYNQAPHMLGYFDLDFVESLKRPETTLLLDVKSDETDSEELTEFKIVADHRYCMSNVIFIAYAAIPEGFTLTDGLKPKFNAAIALSNYIDAIAGRIINLENEWRTRISKISDSELSEIMRLNNKLSTLNSKLLKNQGYYELALNCTDQFVPYKTFIRDFFDECDIYDIIPLLVERLELLTDCMQKYSISKSDAKA